MATRDAANMALSNRMAALMRANDELLARVMALMLACRRRDTRVLGIEYVGDEAPTRDELLLSRITHAVEYVEGIFGGAKPPPPSKSARPCPIRPATHPFARCCGFWRTRGTSSIGRMARATFICRACRGKPPASRP